MGVPTSVIYVAQVTTVARYAFDFEPTCGKGWYRGTARVTTNAGVVFERTEPGDGPERAIAFALERIARDMLELHPRKDRT